MPYYACSYPLAEGSVVIRGNWGRMLRLESIGSGNLQRLLRETAFEKVRLQNYQTRPSRLDSNFTCPTLDSIREFVKVTKRIYDLIYEVEPVDENASRFETDWSLINRPIENLTLEQVEALADQYWSPANVVPMHAEMVIASDIRILRKAL